jgi:hypothetical protein
VKDESHLQTGLNVPRSTGMNDEHKPAGSIENRENNLPQIPLDYRSSRGGKAFDAWSILRIFLMVLGIIVLTGLLAFGVCTYMVIRHA